MGDVGVRGSSHARVSLRVILRLLHMVALSSLSLESAGPLCSTIATHDAIDGNLHQLSALWQLTLKGALPTAERAREFRNRVQLKDTCTAGRVAKKRFGGAWFTHLGPGRIWFHYHINTKCCLIYTLSRR